MTPAPLPLDALAAAGAVAHWIRVHPVRTAAALAGFLLAVALVASLLHYLRRRRRGEPGLRWLARTAIALARARRRTYAAAALSLALLGGGFALLTAFLYRGYTNRLVHEYILPEELEPSTTFGIDVSHYQAHINWDAVARSEHPIRYVFVRATMGYDGRDERFAENWAGAAEVGFVRGAYHYFRPGEDGRAQFDNFARTVDLQPGDLYPVLDVEALGPRGPAALRAEITEWLTLAEQRWGVRPILYTGQTFYTHHLEGHFDDYPLWLAHYSATPDTARFDWRIHQFTDRVRVRGILSRVDGNNFRGTLTELAALRL